MVIKKLFLFFLLPMDTIPRINLKKNEILEKISCKFFFHKNVAHQNIFQNLRITYKNLSSSTDKKPWLFFFFDANI